MSAEGLQRTLIIGLGETGARVADRLLAHLSANLGQLGVVEGIVVRAAEDGGDDLTWIDTALSVSPGAFFAEWRGEWETMLADALRRISRLEHLTRLGEQGLRLRRADEVHLVLIADVSQPWVACSLADVADSLHEGVYRTLTCDSALTGLWLLADTGDSSDNPQCQGNATSSRSSLPVSQPSYLPSLHSLAENNLSGDLFNRGCFVASATNEVGLVIGDADDLVRHAAHFLSLLLASPLEIAADGMEWNVGGLAGREGVPLISFGLAAVRWPGQELVEALSRRWAESVLARLTAPIAGVEEEAQPAAQRLIAGDRLAPPLLIERLAGEMPGLSNYLADEVADPPWPWQLVDVQKRLEAGAQDWEDAWLAARGALESTLTEVEKRWQTAAPGWLAQQVGMAERGALVRTKAHLAALNGLLEAFVEGVEAQAEEAGADLVEVERQMGATAAKLAEVVAAFPASPLEMLLHWGLRPLGWLRRWAACRHAQTIARRYAHLLRNRLMIWQVSYLYDTLLPVYREWATNWKKQVDAWEHCVRQISKASQSPALATWQEQVEEALTGAGGPWTVELVEELYRSAGAADELAPEVAWGRLGPLAQWVEAGLDAGEVVQRLCDYAADALTPWVALPVDLALSRQIPDEEALADWLVSFVDQASPFLRYDEAALAEEARSQVRRDTWLLLPGADDSRLARLYQDWPAPPIPLISQSPEELIAITIRRGLCS
jgi:hypothetical protein